MTHTLHVLLQDEDDELLGADILGSQSVVAAPPTVSGGVPWQLMRTVALCAVGAVVGVGLGLAGLRRWDESPVMSNGSGSPYTADQFSWLVCFILVTPIGYEFACSVKALLFHSLLMWMLQGGTLKNLLHTALFPPQRLVVRVNHPN